MPTYVSNAANARRQSRIVYQSADPATYTNPYINRIDSKFTLMSLFDEQGALVEADTVIRSVRIKNTTGSTLNPGELVNYQASSLLTPRPVQISSGNPEAGTSVVIPISTTTNYEVGQTVEVSDGGYKETPFVTAINAGVSITVDRLYYDHVLPTVTALPAFEVTRATNAGFAPASWVIRESIANGAYGYAYDCVLVTGLNTNALSEEALVYLSTGGAYTVTAPTSADTIQQVVGVVKKAHLTLGEILFWPGPHWILKVGTSYFQDSSVSNVKIAGTIPVSKGGTGLSTITQDGYLVGAGTNAIATVLCKFNGTTAPTVNEDSGDGYAVGSFWWDTTNDLVYGCLDATVGAAVWVQLGGGGTGSAIVNHVDNAGFNFFQRTNPSTLTNFTDAAYGPDRWKLVSQSGTHQFERLAGDSNSTYCVSLLNNAGSASSNGCLQFLRSADSLPLNGVEVTLSARVRCSENNTIYARIVSWDGTADAPTNDPISTWFPMAFVANYTEEANASVAVTATDWTDISVTATITFGTTNIMVFFHVEGSDGGSGGLSNAATFDVTEVMLVRGDTAQAWSPKAMPEDWNNCLYHYCKSFNADQVPQQNSGTDEGAVMYYAQAAGVSDNGVMVRFPIPMFKIPTMTYYNPHAANTKWRNIDDAADSGTPATQALGQGSVVIENPQVAGDGVGERLEIHWSAEAEI